MMGLKEEVKPYFYVVLDVLAVVFRGVRAAVLGVVLQVLHPDRVIASVKAETMLARSSAEIRPAAKKTAETLPAASCVQKTCKEESSGAPRAEEGDLKIEEIPLCADQMEWLERLASRCGHSTPSQALEAVVNFTNGEPAKAKKQIFLVVRCRRCLQHTTGGEKRPFQVSLPATQWLWLNAVRERCRHASVGKTLRIIIDFYMPICKESQDFELVVGGRGGAVCTQVAAAAAGA